MFENLLNRSGLSFDRLRNFLLVVNSGSISKACGGDPIRQSLVSRQIREIEEFFGTQLTLRKGKGIAITPAGHRLATLIREQLQDLVDFHQEQLNLPKQFTFGAGASIIDWLVVPHVPKITAALEGACLRLESHRSSDLVDKVRAGELDFAIVREDAIPKNLPQAALGKITFWFCVGKNLVQSKNNRMPSLWHHLPLATPVPGGSFQKALQRACEDQGVGLKPLIECQSFLQMKQLVKTGEYASILPSIGLHGLASNGVGVYPFTPLKHYGRNLCLHWNQRQMTRRGVDQTTLRAVSTLLEAALLQAAA